jgi:hypothetical protein
MNLSIFQDARFQPTPDQADQARIFACPGVIPSCRSLFAITSFPSVSDAFAPTVRARPNPIFGRPVHQGSPPFDYSPILLLKPFGFRITPDTLSSSE